MQDILLGVPGDCLIASKGTQNGLDNDVLEVLEILKMFLSRGGVSLTGV